MFDALWAGVQLGDLGSMRYWGHVEPDRHLGAAVADRLTCGEDDLARLGLVEEPGFEGAWAGQWSVDELEGCFFVVGADIVTPVSYTHLTLPTNREV